MSDKTDRLKMALRENLKRRKAHSRERTASQVASADNAGKSGNAAKKTDHVRDA